MRLEEEIGREVLTHVLQEGKAVAHRALVRLRPHDAAFHRQWAQSDVEEQVDGGTWGEFDRELHHQSSGADSPYRTVQFSGSNLTAPADGRQADRESAKASPPGQMPPQSFYLLPHLELMPAANPMGDSRIVQWILLADKRRHALFFAVAADDSHRFPHFLTGPSCLRNVIGAPPQPVPLHRVDGSPTLSLLPFIGEHTACQARTREKQDSQEILREMYAGDFL